MQDNAGQHEKISEKVEQFRTMQDIKKKVGQCRTGRHHGSSNHLA